jgi:hypothetical protein
MVKISTLFYLMENLEGKKEELIDLEEVLEMEQKYLERIFGVIDQAGVEVNPSLVDKILHSAFQE